MKTMEQMQKEYNDFMAHCKAAKERGDYEVAARFFDEAQKVWEDGKNDN